MSKHMPSAMFLRLPKNAQDHIAQVEQERDALLKLVRGFFEETRFNKRLGGGKLDQLIDEARTAIKGAA